MPDLSKTAEPMVVGLARAGDEQAFTELVRRRQVLIRNLMQRLSGDRELARDLAQQVFLQAWRDIGKLRSPDKFSAWLKRIAVNTWNQHLRKHLNQKILDGDSALESPGLRRQPGMVVDLESALSTLPLNVRLCVVLAYHEGLSHREISTLTDFPLGTVKSHVKRGSDRLQSLLADYQGASND